MCGQIRSTDVFEKLKQLLDDDQVELTLPRIGNGHIHKSYRLDWGEDSFFVQHINNSIFSDVPSLMSQMQEVTTRLSKYYANRQYETLELLLTSENVPYLNWKGQYWRVFCFKVHLQGYEQLPDHTMLKSAARAYASFVQALNGFDTESAFEPIRDFHGMEFRIKQLEDAKLNNPALAKTCLLEIKAIEELIVVISPLSVALQSRELPVRMVHNDTKINNLLFDESHEARCVVDLDTVMPGSVVYDVGDALRTLCSNLSEDDPSVDQLIIDEEAADIFIDAYQTEAGWLEEGERKWLSLSPVYMSLIMGIRFLTDYLQGDMYFHTARTGHNLDRARNQIKLARLFADRFGHI